MTWTPKRAGFESGGSRTRGTGQKNRRQQDILTFSSWRAAILGSLTADNIAWRILEDGTIEADLPGGKRRMEPGLQRENFDMYLQKIKEESR